MAASASFMATAQAAVLLLPQYAAFQAAQAAFSAAGEATRQAAWAACYSDAQIGHSPAYKLRRAIRNAIANTMASLAVTLSPTDVEAAYQQLTALLVPETAQPDPGPQVRPAVVTQEDLDLIRAAAARLASD